VTGPTNIENTPDPEAAEDFADNVGVDPTQEQIDIYRRMEGEDAAEPPPAVEGPPTG
jgi:hypothetical protein